MAERGTGPTVHEIPMSCPRTPGTSNPASCARMRPTMNLRSQAVRAVRSRRRRQCLCGSKTGPETGWTVCLRPVDAASSRVRALDDERDGQSIAKHVDVRAAAQFRDQRGAEHHGGRGEEAVRTTDVALAICSMARRSVRRDVGLPNRVASTGHPWLPRAAQDCETGGLEPRDLNFLHSDSCNLDHDDGPSGQFGSLQDRVVPTTAAPVGKCWVIPASRGRLDQGHLQPGEIRHCGIAT